MAEAKSVQQPKGLNYQSMIETLSVRVHNRFLTEQASTESEKLKSPHIYLTSAMIQDNQLSQLDLMIINDLKQSLEKNNLIVEIPPELVPPSHVLSSECENRIAALHHDMKIILSSKSCTSQIDCMLIGLYITYQGKNLSETCHLTLTQELLQKKNETYHIPIQSGHIKKPFKNLDQLFKYIVENMHCMFNELSLSAEPLRLLFAKTDKTSDSIVEAMKKQWRNQTGKNNIAQTIIPIDCYGEQFAIRDAKISESIPDDIQLLIAIDAIEIYPGKFRIRVHALYLKDQTLTLINNQSISFGSCLPGCRFNLFTYTKSKGKSLTGEGSGTCVRDMPQHLRAYSAKILAENSARETLTNTIKHLLRKYYIANNLTYYESILDDKTETIMNNAILEWENFDEHTCQAEARFIIHDSFLPFALLSEPEPITQQNVFVQTDSQKNIQENLMLSQEPKSITRQELLVQPEIQNIHDDFTQSNEPQSIQSSSELLMQSFNQAIKKRLTQDKIPKPIIQIFETVGNIERKACFFDIQLDPKRVRCPYEYDLTFIFSNKQICVCKGTINGVGNNLKATHDDVVAALIDLLYPFPLDIAMALNNQISLNNLKQTLIDLDKKYFQLLEEIDTLLEFIQASQTGG
jgi:hypothetical protein